ncbi:MAG: prolipoprotein diacylglyceryl transferase [Oscillospiraceae bacterium]|nr:prolipoprotein diacylglyceryl transferase [Oscillospiraceae bacterium]
MFLASPISFPNLGITVNPSRVAFTVFGKDIYWYGIIIAVGFILAAVYACRRAPQFGLTEEHVLDLLFIAVPFAIVFARLYYCVFYWDLYRDNPVSILYIWEGGLAIYGGVIGAVLGLMIYTKFKKIPPGPLMDLGGLGLLIGQLIGRWGNFVNREAHGSITDGFFKMGLVNAAGETVYYHPTFLYESVWNLAGFVLLHFYSRKRRRYDGEIFTMYIAWYGLGRSWIEGLRTDSLYLFGTGLRVSQLLAVLSCLAAVSLLVWKLYVRPADPERMLARRMEKKVEAAVEAAGTNWKESSSEDTETEK